MARLSAARTLTLGKGDNTLGYEWDVDADNGWRPAGEFDLSLTTLSGVQPFADYGSTTGTGTVTHNLSLYRAPSGALVFGAGSVQWAWGLDDTNGWADAGPPSGATPDPNMQQATVNLFADMGSEPATPIAGLTAERHQPTARRRPRRSPRRRPGRTFRTATRSPSLGPPATAAAASWPVWKFRPTAARPGIPPRSPPLLSRR